MRIQTQDERELLLASGRVLASVVRAVAARAVLGVSTEELEAETRRRIESADATPAFLGYKPQGASRSYPAALCTSINEEVVHGIPNESPRILTDGDIITVDAGVTLDGFVTDMAITVPVGRVDQAGRRLIAAAEEALAVAIATARAGKTTGDIGHAVEEVARRYGFSVPRELGGHGVGKHVHEDPFVPNFGKPATGEVLVPGMVLAIEPIIIEGGGAVRILADGYTYVTKDGSRSAQFEHTIIVTEGEPEIVTR